MKIFVLPVFGVNLNVGLSVGISGFRKEAATGQIYSLLEG